MRIELPMGYAFIVPEKGRPYIINSYGEEVVSTLITETAVGQSIYNAMNARIKQLEMNIATLEGELELLENLSKLSGATDKYSKRR